MTDLCTVDRREFNGYQFTRRDEEEVELSIPTGVTKLNNGLLEATFSALDFFLRVNGRACVVRVMPVIALIILISSTQPN
jgi:hypothetical protein